MTSLTLAQAAPPTPATPPQTTPAPVVPRDNVEDLTSTTLSSPTPAPAATAPVPAAQPAATVREAPTPAPALSPTSASGTTTAPEEPDVSAGPRIRRGFYLRFNTATGYAGFTGSGPNGHASIQGLASQTLIAIGGSVGSGVVLAGTLQGSGTTATFKGGPFEDRSISLGERSVAASRKADAAFSQIGLLIDWYPKPAIGWHVGASGGLGAITVLNRADESSFVGAGLAGTIFGGYDWFIAKEWSMGLSLVMSGMTTVNMKESEEGNNDAGYKLRALSLGLAGSILYF